MRLEAHPDEVVTASYLDGTLGGEALHRVEAHFARCEECRAGLALLALERGAGAEPVAPSDAIAFRNAALAPPPARTTRSAPAWILGAAAVVVAAIGLSLWFAQRAPANGPRIERDGDAAAIRALSPGAGDVVVAERMTFRFTPVPGADRYVVRITDGTGRSLADLEVRAADEPVGWPGDRPVPRGTLLWSVQAMRLDRVLAETRPVAFESR